MNQYLLVKMEDFVISVPGGDKSSKAEEWLLVFLLLGEWILKDGEEF